MEDKLDQGKLSQWVELCRWLPWALLHLVWLDLEEEWVSCLLLQLECLPCVLLSLPKCHLASLL